MRDLRVKKIYKCYLNLLLISQIKVYINIKSWMMMMMNFKIKCIFLSHIYCAKKKEKRNEKETMLAVWEDLQGKCEINWKFKWRKKTHVRILRVEDVNIYHSSKAMIFREKKSFLSFHNFYKPRWVSEKVWERVKYL